MKKPTLTSAHTDVSGFELRRALEAVLKNLHTYKNNDLGRNMQSI